MSGKDGTIFKSFTWNAINTPLESFLIKSKNKFINIAGKVRLNEWNGKKNIDFMIEDISVGQLFKFEKKLLTNFSYFFHEFAELL